MSCQTPMVRKWLCLIYTGIRGLQSKTMMQLFKVCVLQITLVSAGARWFWSGGVLRYILHRYQATYQAVGGRIPVRGDDSTLSTKECVYIYTHMYLCTYVCMCVCSWEAGAIPSELKSQGVLLTTRRRPWPSGCPGRVLGTQPAIWGRAQATLFFYTFSWQTLKFPTPATSFPAMAKD